LDNPINSKRFNYFFDMPKKEETAIRKKINEMYEENEYANLQQNKNRARSITVGTAFGGAIEVNMRGDYGSLWCILSPVEALEVAEQLAAACGVQVAMKPKDDFSAWRGWDVDNTEYIHWKGAAPWQVSPENKHANKQLEAGEEQKQLPPSKEEIKKEFKKRVKQQSAEESVEDDQKPQRKRTPRKRAEG
jgi:hypothetical protein